MACDARAYTFEDDDEDQDNNDEEANTRTSLLDASEDLLGRVKEILRDMMHVSEGAHPADAADCAFDLNMYVPFKRSCSVLVRLHDLGPVPGLGVGMGFLDGPDSSDGPDGPDERDDSDGQTLRLYRGTVTLSGYVDPGRAIDLLALEAFIRAGTGGMVRSSNIERVTMEVGHVSSTAFPRLFGRFVPSQQTLPTAITLGMTTECCVTVESFVPLQGVVCVAQIVPRPPSMAMMTMCATVCAYERLPQDMLGNLVHTNVDWGTCGEDGVFTNPCVAAGQGPSREAVLHATDLHLFRTDDTTNLALYSLTLQGRPACTAGVNSAAVVGAEDADSGSAPPLLSLPHLIVIGRHCVCFGGRPAATCTVNLSPEQPLWPTASIRLQLLSLDASPVPPVRLFVTGTVTYRRYECL